MNLNKIIELGAIGVGGVSLFMASFLVFALSAGVPAHQVAIVGGLFPEPDPTGQAGTGQAIDGATPDIVEKTMEEVLISTLNGLPTYSSQSPFSDGEMGQVVEELKRTKLAYEEGVRDIEEREAEMEDRDANADERDRILKELMADLDRREREMKFLQQELDLGIKVADEAKEAEWEKMSRAFSGEGDYDQLAKRLKGYTADEAALILKNLAPEQRQSIMDALDTETFLDFNKAYSLVAE